jgi:outer membrane protein TolC
MKYFAPLLAALLALWPAPIPAQTTTLGIKELGGMIAAGDPRLRISAQSLRLANAAYRSIIAAAYPQLTATSSYSLDLVPDLKSQVLVSALPVPTYQTQETQNQASQLVSARLSVSQLLPTSGALSLSVEDTMAVLTSSEVSTGGAEPVTVDPRFSQSPKATVSLSQPILFNGKLLDMQLFPATLRKAQLDFLRAQEDNRDLVNRSLSAAVQSLLGVLQLRKTIGTTTLSLEISQKRLERAKKNLTLGLVSELDVWETELAIGKQREGLLDLQYSLARAERQLAQSLGRENLEGLQLDERVPALRLDLDRDEIEKRALARNPVVQGGAMSLEGKKLDKTIAGQQDATTLTLSFGVQPRYPSSREDTSLKGSFSELAGEDASIDWIFGVGVTVPVYRGGKQRYTAESADALERIAGENLILSRKQVTGDIQSLFLTRQNLEEKASLLENNADLLARRVEIEKGLLALGKSTDLDLASRELDLEAKRVEAWKARADLVVAVLSLYVQAGEDLQRVIEGATL